MLAAVTSAVHPALGAALAAAAVARAAAATATQSQASGAVAAASYATAPSVTSAIISAAWVIAFSSGTGRRTRFFGKNCTSPSSRTISSSSSCL